jgi:hypothetical protein
VRPTPTEVYQPRRAVFDGIIVKDVAFGRR